MRRSQLSGSVSDSISPSVVAILAFEYTIRLSAKRFLLVKANVLTGIIRTTAYLLALVLEEIEEH